MAEGQPECELVLLPPKGAGGAPRRIAGTPVPVWLARLWTHAGAAPGSDQRPASPMLLLARADRLVDPRLAARLAAAAAPARLVDAQGLIVALKSPRSALPRLPADAEALAAAAAPEGSLTLEAGQVPAYSPRQRRDVPVRILPLATASDCARAETLLLADAQNGVLDWPARFLHPRIENMIVRLLWPAPVTPNQVSLATFLLGLAAMTAFAASLQGLGLALMLLLGPLDGVDGKLARTRLQVTKAGEYEHLADKVVEYGAYVALALGLVAQGGDPVLAIVPFLACLALAADVAIGGAAERLLGRPLDDAGAFERRWRLVSARRNVNFWGLVPFGLAGAWTEGLVAIAGWSILSMLVRLWRLSLSLRRLETWRSA